MERTESGGFVADPVLAERLCRQDEREWKRKGYEVTR